MMKDYKDEMLKWLHICEAMNQDYPSGEQEEKPKEEDEVSKLTPSEILEKVRKILNTDISKNGDEDTQINDILSQAGKYFVNFVPKEESPEPTAQSTSQSSIPQDTSPAQGIDMQPTPQSGGQI